MLEGWLDYHRTTLAMKCAGLSDEQLRSTPLAPSELSLMGLVRHMTEVERNWFQEVALGAERAPLYFSDADRDGDFHTTEADTWGTAEAAWLEEIARSRTSLAGLGLDDLCVRPDRVTGGRFNVRWILNHMIEEYARHNGHADLLREHIDGATGE
ncbi:DinB family protein [Streptomyces tsukubensis]|nr:DinB family protein [Streptomyces tsukubensis]